MCEYYILKGGRGNMKTILISQEKLHKTACAAMREYINKMKSHDEDGDKYSKTLKLSDVLTLLHVFALFEDKLFNGGESSEQ